MSETQRWLRVEYSALPESTMPTNLSLGLLSFSQRAPKIRWGRSSSTRNTAPSPCSNPAWTSTQAPLLPVHPFLVWTSPPSSSSSPRFLPFSGPTLKLPNPLVQGFWSSCSWPSYTCQHHRSRLDKERDHLQSKSCLSLRGLLCSSNLLPFESLPQKTSGFPNLCVGPSMC